MNQQTTERARKGLEITRVLKEDLLKTIRDNRARHEQAFKEAMQVFREEAGDTIKKAIKELKEISTAEASLATPEQVQKLAESLQEATMPLHLRYPEQHLDDYDKTVKKLEMSIDSEVELTDEEFNRYVMDNWAWKMSFHANTVAYAGKLGRAH